MGTALGSGSEAEAGAAGCEAVPPGGRLPPRPVWLLGAVWVAVGAGAAAGMVQAVLTEEFSLNLLVVGLWIGGDVLRGRRGGQRWGTVLAFLGFVVTGGVAALSGWQREWTDCGAASLCSIGWLLMVWLHRSRGTAEWFGPGAPRVAGWRDWRTAISLAAAVVCLWPLWSVWELKRAVAGYYRADVRVVGVDAGSGTRLELNSMSGVDGGGAPVKLLEGLRSFSSSFDDGVLQVGAGAFGPVTFEVGAEGYRGRAVRIDAETGGEVTVELDRER